LLLILKLTNHPKNQGCRRPQEEDHGRRVLISAARRNSHKGGGGTGGGGEGAASSRLCPGARSSCPSPPPCPVPGFSPRSFLSASSVFPPPALSLLSPAAPAPAPFLTPFQHRHTQTLFLLTLERPQLYKERGENNYRAMVERNWGIQKVCVCRFLCSLLCMFGEEPNEEIWG
jgi:hypothetical protein